MGTTRNGDPENNWFKGVTDITQTLGHNQFSTTRFTLDLHDRFHKN